MRFTRTVPILRIFDVDKAREFYVEWLGFTVDWEHRFGANFPFYMQVSRGALVLHLSEHHGDATPGSSVFVDMTGIEELYKQLSAAKYRYNKPGLESVPWNARMVEVIDPFGNRIRFNEYNASVNE